MQKASKMQKKKAYSLLAYPLPENVITALSSFGKGEKKRGKRQHVHAKGQVWPEFIIFQETFYFNRSCSLQDKSGASRAMGDQPELRGLMISACEGLYSYLQENYSGGGNAMMSGCWCSVFMYAFWS